MPINNKRTNMKTYKYLFSICLLIIVLFDLSAQDTMQQPFDLGSKGFSFTFTDTKNTTNYSNDYSGEDSNDVFYKLTLTTTMDIIVSHCGSGINDTYLHILNASGEEIESCDDYSGDNCCANDLQSYIKITEMPAGTYYIVSEGYGSNNGNITTSIDGIKALPSTGLYDGSAVGSSTNAGINYIFTITPTVATCDVRSLGVNESLQTVQYFDGLGRPVETVQRGITPQKNDLITYTEYDSVGREWKQWFPAYKAGNNGAYVDKTTFTSQAATTYNGDSRPFNEIGYEPSPLNRVTNQYGAGQAWASHPVSIAYQTNDASIAYYYVNASGNLQRGSNYAASTLFVTKTTDEDGKFAYEYKDKLGQVVLKRQILDGNNVDTYYVYNDLGQLNYVLPPLGADGLTAFSAYSDDNTILKKYAYLYKYDERDNCIAKRLPGCSWVYMVYDKAERMVLSQDGNQRVKNQWTAIKYDILGRVVYTGTTTNSSTRDQLQSVLSSTVVTETFDGSTGFYNTGYTCSSATGTFGTIKPLTVNYYDKYSFRKLQTAIDTTQLMYSTLSGYDAQYTSAKGLLTGRRTYLLNNSNVYTSTAMYYNYRGLVVQSRSSNHLGGYDISYNQYDFTGKVLKNRKDHNISGQNVLTEIYTNTYDNAGRLTKTTYKLNNNAEITLTDMTASGSYDELGRLHSKKRHGGTDIETYTYNIRSWTTLITSGGGFEEKLYYNTNPLINDNVNYNGNISYSTWTYNDTEKGYIFWYDNLNRLTFSILYNYDQPSGLSESFTYDKMGNITHLNRFVNPLIIDDLSFYYEGNQLAIISDAAGSQSSYTIKEYQNKSTTTIFAEMTYDANGNMVKDLDRDIVTIRYNLLNLPDTIQFKNGNQIRNLYDASGKKLRAEYSTLGSQIVIPVGSIGSPGNPNNCNDYLEGIDYLDNIEYIFSNDCGDYQLDLDKIYNSEGYVTTVTNPQYHYYRRDHLGNNREVWLANTNTTVQRTQYYPSGLPWAYNTGDNPSVQNKKYNGKEFVEMHGYDTYDIVWRQYYPAIMRFQTPDPEVEEFYDISPYAMCDNNMVINVDPDGRWLETAWDIYNVVSGAKSFVDNVRKGNVGAAIVDGVGVLVDAAAVALPVVPAGAGTAIKIARTADKVNDAVKTGKTAEKVAEGASNAMKNRVKLQKETKEIIKNNAPKTKDGRFIDPNTGKPIEKGQEVYGHKTGQEWSKYKKASENKDKSRKEVIKDQNNPNIYQIEDKKSNASHKYEERQQR
jgi:RHS repeat-associated protein